MEPFLKNSKRQISKSNKKIVSNRSLYRVILIYLFSLSERLRLNFEAVFKPESKTYIINQSTILKTNPRLDVEFGNLWI